SGLSAGLLSIVSRGGGKRPVLPAGDYSAVGQLPGSGVCMENNPWQRWSAEYAVAVFPPGEPSARFPLIQSIRGCVDAHAHLHPFYVLADLRFARAYSAGAGGGIAGSRGIAAADVLASHLSTVHPRRAGGCNLRIRA